MLFTAHSSVRSLTNLYLNLVKLAKIKKLKRKNLVIEVKFIKLFRFLLEIFYDVDYDKNITSQYILLKIKWNVVKIAQITCIS